VKQIIQKQNVEWGLDWMEASMQSIVRNYWIGMTGESCVNHKRYCHFTERL